MNFLFCILLTILVGFVVKSNTQGAIKRRWPVAIRTTRHVSSETGTAAQPLSLVKKRSTSKGKALEESNAVNFGRRKRYAFSDMSGDPSLMFFHHPSEHGTFNQDTVS